MRKRTYQTQTWEEWYECAKNYYSKFGDLLISRDFVTADGFRLGRWIERQRGMYNGVLPSSLNKERCIALEKIGMIWKLEDRFQWKRWLEMAEEYRQEYGSLDVPSEYVTKDGCRLGFWIKEQRKKYWAGSLTEKQVRELEHCGIAWQFYKRKGWNDWLQIARAYYGEHGNLLVPRNYKTAAGEKLGNWIFVQRERYYRESGRRPLSPEQIKALEQLSMVWSLKDVREERWDEMLRWIKAYKSKYGRLPLNPAVIAPDGRSMGNWISVQRTALGKGRMSEWKTESLADVGILPFGTAKEN